MNNLKLITHLMKFELVTHPCRKNFQHSTVIQLLTFLFIFSSTAFAAPIISNLSDKAGALEISGSSFGADQGATTPLFWDNFDSGSDGAALVTQLAGSVPWEQSGFAAKYYSAQKHSGTQSAYALHSNNNHWSFFTVGNFATPLPDSLTYYHTFWFRYNTPRPMGTPGEIKLLRIFGDQPTSSIPDKPYHKTGGVGKADGTVWWSTSYKAEAQVNEPYKTWTSEPTENTWHRAEAIYKQSSAGGVADGSIQLIIDGVTQAVFNNIVTRDSNDHRWIKADFFSGMTNWDTGNTGLKWEKWLDDAYLSKTWQRVEMCNSSTWATRTHCELQPVTKWADGQITFTANKGSFSTGTMYLFVVDTNGMVTDGYPIFVQ